MNDLLIVPCPRCHAPVVYHPGLPPGVGTNWLNRCRADALTGQPGAAHVSRRGTDSWFWPERRPGTWCGCAVTDPAGTLIPASPMDAFIAITRQPFRPEALG